MSEFISSIAPLMRAFVAFRKASERWNEASYEVNLSLFDKYCDKLFPNVSEYRTWWIHGAPSAKRKQTTHADQEYIPWLASYVISANAG